ncbi:uncharacterized protein HKW66_Vig0120430 [Vigna angularis]|uniref:Uncharacterized protein n=2 Tax=Phaseolus angularis TaxID=3914 RepID=A0A8T0JZ91_PHAAN|nr:uncharacterized protein HKW66_Vig0120430 [Vigna angularis]BAU02497.1 hypothetical protein VIGAN_11203900 [Vigna angularis var. angularis]
MRAPSAILRSLSLRRIQPRAASAAVAPLPATTQFSRDLTAELTTLQSVSKSGEYSIPQLFDAAITTQKIALNALAHLSYFSDVDRGAIEDYLETNTDILDACNYFVERVEGMKKNYVETLRNVARFVEINATSRALDRLVQSESSQGTEKRRLKMGKPRTKQGHETELGEILCGSKAMALMSCCFLEQALSIDCGKSEFPMMKGHPMSCSWLRIMQLAEKKRRSGSLVMVELQQTVGAAKELKELIKGKKGKEMVECCVERVKRSCKELEDEIGFIEGKVRDLYRSLIDFRMVLLGILSQS